MNNRQTSLLVHTGFNRGSARVNSSAMSLLLRSRPAGSKRPASLTAAVTGCIPSWLSVFWSVDSGIRRILIGLWRLFRRRRATATGGKRSFDRTALLALRGCYINAARTWASGRTGVRGNSCTETDEVRPRISHRVAGGFVPRASRMEFDLSSQPTTVIASQIEISRRIDEVPGHLILYPATDSGYRVG